MESSSTENLNRTPHEGISEGIIDLMDVPDTPMNVPGAAASGFASARAVDLTNSDDEEEEEDRKLPARDMDTNITDNEWSCPRCTLINKNTNPRCDACQYINADIYSQRNRNSSTTRDTQGSPAQHHQQQRSVSSPMGYIGSGALFGAAVGMTGNWMQGRNVISGALEGGTTGAMGGALLHEVLQNNPREARREMPRTQADRARYTTHNGNTTPIQPFRYQSNEADGTISSRNSSSNNNRNNTSSGGYRNGAYARSSAAAGALEYSTVDRSYTNTNVDNPMYDIGAAGRSYRARPRYVTRSQIGMLHDFRDSNGSILRGHDANQDLIAILQNRSNLLRERMHALERASALRAQFSGMRQGDNIDSMNYEQLLHAFGDGTENMGADEREIGRLPTHTVGDQPLPEDSRQCPICLEDFEKGEARTILPCLHGFHEDCCHKWLKTNGKCPICKHPISSNGG